MEELIKSAYKKHMSTVYFKICAEQMKHIADQHCDTVLDTQIVQDTLMTYDDEDFSSYDLDPLQSKALVTLCVYHKKYRDACPAELELEVFEAEHFAISEILLMLGGVDALNDECSNAPVFNANYNNFYQCLFMEYRSADELVGDLTRMSFNNFIELVNLLQPYFSSDDTNQEVNCIFKMFPTMLIVMVLMNHLTMGENFTTISKNFMISPTSIKKIVVKCCGIILGNCRALFTTSPNIYKWDTTIDTLPHCIEINAKHIAIQRPSRKRNSFFNPCGYYSVILLAILDSRKFFHMVCVDNGNQSVKFRWLPDAIATAKIQWPVHHIAALRHTTLSIPCAIIEDPTTKKKEITQTHQPAQIYPYSPLDMLLDTFLILGCVIDLDPIDAMEMVMVCTILFNYMFRSGVPESPRDT